MQKAAILLTFYIVAINAGCGGPAQNANAPGGAVVSTANSNNQPNTNAEELGLHVKMPYETEDIVWRMYQDKKRILAVMRYSPSDAERVVVGSGGPGEPVSLPAEPWFPEDLIAQSEMSGDNALKGTSMPATAYLQPPFSVGKLIRVSGTNYFVLDVIGQ